MKKVQERTNLDLLELTLQLHSRAINQPNNREMHGASVEARQELEKRLQVNNNAVLPHVSSCADVDKGHGVCKEKGCDKYATKDYNGHDHWVCDSCYDSLNYSFILKL